MTLTSTARRHWYSRKLWFHWTLNRKPITRKFSFSFLRVHRGVAKLFFFFAFRFDLFGLFKFSIYSVSLVREEFHRRINVSTCFASTTCCEGISIVGGWNCCLISVGVIVKLISSAANHQARSVKNQITLQPNWFSDKLSAPSASAAEPIRLSVN